MTTTRSMSCRGCGRAILLNDEAQSIAHAHPECDYFKNLIAQNPSDETRVVHEGAIEAHFQALADRVRLKPR